MFTKEQVIFRAQQLEFIYSQSGVLQKIIPDAPRSKVDISKTKLGLHANGLVGSIDDNTTNLLNQLQQFSLQTASSMHALPSTPMPSQPMSINVVQTSNPKGNQQSEGKNKGRRKKKN